MTLEETWIAIVLLIQSPWTLFLFFVLVIYPKPISKNYISHINNNTTMLMSSIREICKRYAENKTSKPLPHLGIRRLLKGHKTTTLSFKTEP